MSKQPLNSQEIERYARHIILPEIGGAGQQALKAARVLVIGAGGLGAPVLQYLAAAGVGMLGIVDDDTVSLSNLQRQVIHGTLDVGKAKVDSGAEAIRRINPHVEVIRHKKRLDAANAGKLFSGYDIVVDGSDNFETRYLAADTAERLQITLVTAAVGRFDGSLTVLQPWKTAADGRPNPRYRDLFPAPPPAGVVSSCAEAGIVGGLTGVLGTLQAMEVIKVITGAGEPLVGRLLMYDGLAARFETINYRRRGKPVQLIPIDKTFEDWDALLNLILCAFASMHPRIDPPSSALRLTLQSLKERAMAEKAYAAVEKGRLLGCVFCNPEPSGCLYIGKLAVVPQAQGKGVGRLMLQAAIDYAVACGLTCLRLETRIELEENQRIFARWGFVKTAEASHPGFTRPTYIEMRKAL